MSYGIVRVQKFTAGSVKGIEIHDKREKDKSHTNKEIDWSKTDLNYDLAPDSNLSFSMRAKERINQLGLKRAVRKDAIVVAQALVTSDKSFFDSSTPQETEQFFKDSYEFLADRYGKENVVSATVHMDEKTPHMHFNFVPVTDDNRLSAKRVLNRIDLIKQQDEFHEMVGKKYGLERGKKREENPDFKKHQEMAELKNETIRKEMAAIENRVSVIENINSGFDQIDSIQGKKQILHSDKVSVDVADFEKLKNYASQGLKAILMANDKDKEIKHLKEDNKSLTKSVSRRIDKAKEHEVQTRQYKAEISSLSEENELLVDYITAIDEKPNTSLFRDFKITFESEKWADLDMHLKRLKNKPLSEENLAKHVGSTVDGLIDSNNLEGLSKLDKIAVKKLGLKALKDRLNTSKKFKFNENSKTYDVAPKVQKQKAPQISR